MDEVLRNSTYEFLIITKNGLFVQQTDPIKLTEDYAYAHQFNMREREIKKAAELAKRLGFELKKVTIHEIKTRNIVDFKEDDFNGTQTR